MHSLEIYCPECEHPPEHHAELGCACTGDENRPCRCDYTFAEIIELYQEDTP